MFMMCILCSVYGFYYPMLLNNFDNTCAPEVKFFPSLQDLNLVPGSELNSQTSRCHCYDLYFTRNSSFRYFGIRVIDLRIFSSYMIFRACSVSVMPFCWIMVGPASQTVAQHYPNTEAIIIIFFVMSTYCWIWISVFVPESPITTD